MPEDEAFWARQARRLALRANFGFWCASFAPAAITIGAVSGALLLLARRHDFVEAWLALTLSMLAAAGGNAYFRSRDRRFTIGDGFVRLEWALRLESRLSAVAAGVGSWPDPSLYRPIWRFRRARLVTPLVLGLGLPAVGALVPLSPIAPAAQGRTEAPLSVAQTAEWLQGLEENPVVQPESLRPFEDRLASLKSEPQKNWYDESHLEAGDVLRDQLATETRGLATDLDAAASALENQELTVSGDGEETALEGALKGLESRTLALDSELLKRLKDAGMRRRLSPVDAASLARRLREGAGFCRATLRECRAGDRDCIAVARRGAGRGGVQRGPGAAPLTLDAEAATHEAGRLEGVGSDDLRQAALGELVGTSVGRPRADRSAQPGSRGGGAAVGKGGDAVGRSVLTPEERRVLERYFTK